MVTIEGLLNLFKLIDYERSISAKLAIFRQWAESNPEILAARIICFDNAQLSTTSDVAVSIPSQNAKMFPKEPGILNGRSPLPAGIFQGDCGANVTVYYPFFFEESRPGGALLFRCEGPKRFLAKNSEPLGLLASKTRDIIYTGQLRQYIRKIEEPMDSTTGLSQETLGNLMNFLSLPIYITDRNGAFVNVNAEFLRQFQYGSCEELKEAADFFIDTDDWSEGIKKLMTTGGLRGYTTKVRTGSGETRIVQDSATLIGKHTFGILFDITDYVSLNEELLDTLEAQKKLNQELINTTSMLQKTQSTTMKSLAMLAEYRDMETGNHLHRICEYNKQISEKVYEAQPYSFHISSDYVDDIYLSGMLHDIGKVGVPDSILLKAGSLSVNEWDIMRKHTVWGWDILHQADQELGEQSFLTLASRIALAHHEWYDGNGYPRGLQGENIPLSARISAVSDVYDALTSRRPYKGAWTHDQAVEEILKEKGKQFDPVIVEILENIENDFRRIKHDFPDDGKHSVHMN